MIAITDSTLASLIIQASHRPKLLLLATFPPRGAQQTTHESRALRSVNQPCPKVFLGGVLT